jgi:hypothetical protein
MAVAAMGVALGGGMTTIMGVAGAAVVDEGRVAHTSRTVAEKSILATTIDPRITQGLKSDRINVRIAINTSRQL